MPPYSLKDVVPDASMSNLGVGGESSGHQVASEIAKFYNELRPLLESSSDSQEDILSEYQNVQPNKKGMLGGVGIIALLSLLGGKHGMQALGPALQNFTTGYSGSEAARMKQEIDPLAMRWKALSEESKDKRGLVKDLASEWMKGKVKGMYSGGESIPGSDKILAQIMQWQMRNPDRELPAGYKAALDSLYQMKAIPQEFYNAIIEGREFSKTPFGSGRRGGGGKGGGIVVNPGEGAFGWK